MASKWKQESNLHLFSLTWPWVFCEICMFGQNPGLRPHCGPEFVFVLQLAGKGGGLWSRLSLSSARTSGTKYDFETACACKCIVPADSNEMKMFFFLKHFGVLYRAGTPASRHKVATSTEDNTCGTHLDLGRNMEPSMKTDPDSRMYQHELSSPRLKTDDKILQIDTPIGPRKCLVRN